MAEASSSAASVGTNTHSRSCWVCFGTDEDGDTKWVRPCRCKGTAMWVHHACLLRWIDEKEGGHSTFAKVKCPQCNTEYQLAFPQFDRLTRIIQYINQVVHRASPLFATGVLLGSIYWTAVTYGAITVMQVLGHKEGLDKMERAEPFFLLIGLPMIPAVLVLGKMIRWEDYLLKLWSKHSQKLAVLRKVFLATSRTRETDLPLPPVPTEVEETTRQIKFTRVLCGAMIFPTVATVFGKLLFHHVQSNFQRSVFGGAIFVAMKGFFNIYLKYQVQSRRDQREIKNYEKGSGQDSTS